jgi:hypothetical protein
MKMSISPCLENNVSDFFTGSSYNIIGKRIFMISFQKMIPHSTKTAPEAELQGIF